MSAAAGRFHPRPPRYVFRIEDQSFMRFAAMETRGQTSSARVRDLSETGLAFTLPDPAQDSLPEEGDTIKIEFNVPGKKQIACFATVVRIESRSDWDPDWGHRGHALVALHFRHLPEGHLSAIRLGLEGKITPEENAQWAGDSQEHALAFGISCVGLGVCLFAMALPPTAWLHFLARLVSGF